MPGKDWLEMAKQRAAAALPPPALKIGDGVGEIPLIELLQDFVETNPKGARLTVSHSGTLPEAIGHGMSRYDGRANRYNITLNAAALRASGEFEDVVAHEIAHLFDPIGIGHDPAHEDFANALGPLLLEQQPPTFAAAQPLIAQVEADQRSEPA